MTIVWVYTFADGTRLWLLNGLSVEDVWKLQEIHGVCTVSFRHAYEVDYDS